MKVPFKELIKGVYPFFVASTIILLFGPLIIYFGNIIEFNSKLTIVLSLCVSVLAAVTILFAIVYRYVSDNARIYIKSFFTVLSVVLWIQGNFLVWKYGLLDGQGILYEYFDWRGLDILIWLCAIFISILSAKSIARFSLFVCSILLFVQVLYTGFIFNANLSEIRNKKEYSHAVTDKIIQFSDKQNIIHIILDAFQSDLFEKTINSNSDFYSNKLDGFVFFPDTVGSFPTTYMSVPAIFSGINYKNDIPMHKFFSDIFENHSFLPLLGQKGYDRESVATGMRGFANFTAIHNVPKPFYGSSFELGFVETLSLLDFSLFRYLPHLGKGLVYDHGKWCFQKLSFHPELNYTPINHARFFEKYIQLIKVNPRKNPSYKFIHLFSTHAPVVLNCECEYIGKPVSSVQQYDEKYLLPHLCCGINQVIMLIEKLKEIGIYDDCMIILQGDHGFGRPVNVKNYHEDLMHANYLSKHIIGCAMPLMAIKKFSSTGKMKISKVQASLTDIPATIMQALDIENNFPGEPLFDLGEEVQRDRRYLHYRWRHEYWQGEYLERLDEFAVRGPVTDAFSWDHVATYFPPEQQKNSVSD